MTSELPDFTSHGYELIAQIGINPTGGRVTYLAKENSSAHQFVIKQFQFAKGSNWNGYKAIEQEIKVLKSLNYPGIPKYIKSFETENGLCLVQEFINAQPLSAINSYSTQQIHSVAKSILEILVYLQSLHPPILHRDIKPENILMDANGRVYLVDFGFARFGGRDIGLSSMVVGTMGFMAPEQIFGRELTLATDLYGLGVTLICLLTGTKATEVGKLVDENLKFKIDAAIDQEFMSWLQCIVEPNPAKRFRTAQEALKYYLVSAQESEAPTLKRRKTSTVDRQPQRAINRSEDTDESNLKAPMHFVISVAVFLFLTNFMFNILGLKSTDKVIPQLIQELSHGEK